MSAASVCDVASAVSSVPIERPPRRTVTLSATAVTSCSLCEMKMIVRPSAAIARNVSNSTVRLLRCEHRGRLVEDQHPRVPIEGLEDLDPLLLADRELPDPGAWIDGEPVARPELGHSLLDHAGMEAERAPDVPMVAEDDVLRDRERLHQPEVLVHHADARIERVAGRMELRRPAVELELALVCAGRAR